MLKANNKLLAVISAFAALAALLVFMILPTSQLANGIEHSAKDALWVLVLSPIASLVAAVSFTAIFVKDSDTWSKLSSETIVKAVTGLSAVFGLFNFIVYLRYTIDQFSLGFVAPYAGTSYEILAVAAAVIVALNFIFSAVVIIATKRHSK